MARSKEAGKLERFAGLGILGLTLAAAAALWGLLAATDVRPFWDPDAVALWGLTVRYDLHAPAVLIIVGALVLAVVAGVGIALFEDTVVKAFRRTDPGVEKRPLLPDAAMRFVGKCHKCLALVTALCLTCLSKRFREALRHLTSDRRRGRRGEHQRGGRGCRRVDQHRLVRTERKASGRLAAG